MSFKMVKLHGILINSKINIKKVFKTKDNNLKIFYLKNIDCIKLYYFRIKNLA